MPIKKKTSSETDKTVKKSYLIKMSTKYSKAKVAFHFHDGTRDNVRRWETIQPSLMFNKQRFQKGNVVIAHRIKTIENKIDFVILMLSQRRSPHLLQVR